MFAKQKNIIYCVRKRRHRSLYIYTIRRRRRRDDVRWYDRKKGKANDDTFSSSLHIRYIHNIMRRKERQKNVCYSFSFWQICCFPQNWFNIWSFIEQPHRYTIIILYISTLLSWKFFLFWRNSSFLFDFSFFSFESRREGIKIDNTAFNFKFNGSGHS